MSDPLIYGRPYSDAELDQLRHLVGEGLSFSAIALRMHRTRDSVRKQCHKLQLQTSRNLWSDEERARLAELIREGRRLADCARLMGRSLPAVQSMSRQLCIPRSREFVLQSVASAHAARRRNRRDD